MLGPDGARPGTTGVLTVNGSEVMADALPAVDLEHLEAVGAVGQAGDRDAVLQRVGRADDQGPARPDHLPPREGARLGGPAEGDDARGRERRPDGDRGRGGRLGVDFEGAGRGLARDTQGVHLDHRKGVVAVTQGLQGGCVSGPVADTNRLGAPGDVQLPVIDRAVPLQVKVGDVKRIGALGPPVIVGGVGTVGSMVRRGDGVAGVAGCVKVRTRHSSSWLGGSGGGRRLGLRPAT